MENVKWKINFPFSTVNCPLIEPPHCQTIKGRVSSAKC